MSDCRCISSVESQKGAITIQRFLFEGDPTFAPATIMAPAMISPTTVEELDLLWVMIEFLVRGRVRVKIGIKVRVRVTFYVSVYHWSNCRKYTFSHENQKGVIAIRIVQR